MEIDSRRTKAVDNEILSTEAYDELEPILQKINKKFVRIDDNVRRKNVECFMACTDELIRRMKEVSWTFSDLFQEIRYTGSYYEGSRVKEANEFDVNLVLRVPFDIDIYEGNRTPRGYVQLLVTQSIIQTYRNRGQIEWLLSDGFINAQLVRNWLEGVVASVFGRQQQIIVNNRFSFRILTKSGPAVTLRMQRIDAYKRAQLIDVDFVPVFEFQYPIWPTKTRPFPASCYKTTKWCVTPKVQYNPSDWRLCFAFLEKDMLHGDDKTHLKNVYRLMKRLRDSSVNFKNLKSYHIKTLFLWKVHQLNPRKWKNNSVGQLFMMMLFALENCLKRGEIPFFWDRRMNMIRHLNPSLKNDMRRQIANIRSKIDRLLDNNDIRQLWKYMDSLFFDPSQELQVMGLNWRAQNWR